MEPILGALVLAAVVALVCFTPDGRAWFEDGCDALDEFLMRLRPLGKASDRAMDAASLSHRVTQPADRVKARRTLRRSMRVYLAHRKGDV